MATELDDPMEQLDACYDIAHLYQCAWCGERQGHMPIVVVEDLKVGSHAMIVVACVDCLPNVKEITVKEA